MTYRTLLLSLLPFTLCVPDFAQPTPVTSEERTAVATYRRARALAPDHQHDRIDAALRDL